MKNIFISIIFYFFSFNVLSQTEKEVRTEIRCGECIAGLAIHAEEGNRNALQFLHAFKERVDFDKKFKNFQRFSGGSCQAKNKNDYINMRFCLMSQGVNRYDIELIINFMSNYEKLKYYRSQGSSPWFRESYLNVKKN